MKTWICSKNIWMGDYPHCAGIPHACMVDGQQDYAWRRGFIRPFPTKMRLLRISCLSEWTPLVFLGDEDSCFALPEIEKDIKREGCATCTLTIPTAWGISHVHCIQATSRQAGRKRITAKIQRNSMSFCLPSTKRRQRSGRLPPPPRPTLRRQPRRRRKMQKSPNLKVVMMTMTTM